MRRVAAAAMSDASVRLLKRHAKEPQKALILLHWEFCFTEDDGYELPTIQADDEVVKYLKGKCVSAGVRAATAPMPVNFKEYGVYELVHDEGRWNLHHNFRLKHVEPLVHRVASSASSPARRSLLRRMPGAKHRCAAKRPCSLQ